MLTGGQTSIQNKFYRQKNNSTIYEHDNDISAPKSVPNNYNLTPLPRSSVPINDLQNEANNSSTPGNI